MKFLNLFKRSRLAMPDDWFQKLFTSMNATSGKNINETTALQSSAVFSCVRVISETIASLPLPIYRRIGTGKEKALGHYLYELLHDQPNPEMTSFTFRETMQSHLCLYGNAFAEIEYDRAGRVKGLWVITPDRVQVKRNAAKEIVYDVTAPDGTQITFTSSKMLHLVGLGFDGLIGYSPIRLAKETIGLALATEEYGSRFFGNGGRPSGVLEHPMKLSEEAAKRLRNSFSDAHTGLSNSHRLMILEEGMSYKQIGLPPEDSQFLQTRRFQIADIARIFRVPLHLIGDLERATFSNIEHQSIEFVQHTIRPYLVRWEQAMKSKLLSPQERQSYLIEFNVDALLRGDIKSRYEAYAIARQWGWLSANDIRALENMNAIESGGDIYLSPMNMTASDQLTQEGGGTDEGTEVMAANGT